MMLTFQKYDQERGWFIGEDSPCVNEMNEALDQGLMYFLLQQCGLQPT
jgi:hypothetical protein